MFGTFFYNETIKRSISLFGTLFNNIHTSKIKADGTVLSKNLVPISYGPKQKFLLRLQDDVKAKDGNVTSISLPRMAFELTGFEYDASRQQNKLIRTQKTVLETSDVGKRGFQYQPAPYNLTFTLSILSKNYEARDSNRKGRNTTGGVDVNNARARFCSCCSHFDGRCSL